MKKTSTKLTKKQINQAKNLIDKAYNEAYEEFKKGNTPFNEKLYFRKEYGYLYEHNVWLYRQVKHIENGFKTNCKDNLCLKFDWVIQEMEDQNFYNRLLEMFLNPSFNELKAIKRSYEPYNCEVYTFKYDKENKIFT